MNISIDSRRLAQDHDLELKRLCIAGSISMRTVFARTGFDFFSFDACERAGLVWTNSGLAMLTQLGMHLIGDPRAPEFPELPLYQPPTPEAINAFFLRIGNEVSQ